MTDTNITTNERSQTGTVISNKMDKTAVVRIDRKVSHPLYGKFMKRSSKFHIHDENNECSVGDTVMIKECKPFSKTKSWSLIKIVS